MPEQTDVLDRFRRPVTNEDAGIAMVAVHRQMTKGVPIPRQYLDVLMAMAVEAHAPKSNQAPPGRGCDCTGAPHRMEPGCPTWEYSEETRNAER